MKRKEKCGLTTAATYAAPTTLRTSVQTEGGICAASGDDVKNNNAVELDANSHMQGTTIDASEDEWQY